MQTKPHTTWDKFMLFFRDYTEMFVKARLEALAKRGYGVESVSARTTKNANCHMITVTWLAPTVADERERNKTVLRAMSALLPYSGDVKLFWYKPAGSLQKIDATVLIWLE